MEKRVYNFSAGPAVLPLPALEEAQRDLLAFPGVGSSIMEISHRSKTFTQVIEQAEANLRKLLAIPETHHVLFLQGGAQMQFAMIPLNLLHGADRSADYVLTGTWGNTAIKAADTLGKTRVAYDAKETNYDRIPEPAQLDLDPKATYAHVTSNETIQGVQFPAELDSGKVPLVCDSSSELLSRPVAIEKYGILYACAQKNLGPAGVTMVIIRDDVLSDCRDDLPSMLSFKALAAKKSLLNTPPTFAIYFVKLVTDWLLREFGDLSTVDQTNRKKAAMLYDVIDQSEGFYLGHAQKDCRSVMNVPFKMASADLDEQFLDQAAQQGLAALKGHRSVGGFRASIYNAMPVEGVEALRDFMLDFQAKN